MGRVLLTVMILLLLFNIGANSENLPVLVVTHLRLEYLTNPLGIDAARPRLSWTLASANDSLRDQRQTAYQIVVASSPDKLAAPRGDLWDSGKVPSGQTTEIGYAGKPLESKHFYYWKVRVWDEGDRPSGWSENAYWSMGLLEKSQWASQWISDLTTVTTSEDEEKTRRGVNSGYRCAVASSPDTEKWVAVDLGEETRIDAIRLYPAYPYEWQPGGPAYSFPVRFKIEISNHADFRNASTVVDQTQQDVQAPRMDGSALIYRFAPTQARYVRLVVTRLHEENELFSSFALAEMQVLANGQNLALGKPVSALDSSEGPGWSKAYLVDGIIDTIHSRLLIQPTAMFRKSFSLNGNIRRVTVYATARGLYELRINGNRVGDHMLAPEWTDYSKRIQYQTYDVTSLLQQGDNAIGVYLAAGWYAGHVGLMPARRIYGPTPQFLMHLDVEYADGRTDTIVTDESWKRSPQSPIVSSDVYDGETYDARQEQPGWDTPKFDDKSWLPVAAAPDGTEALVSQRNEPVRVTDDITPVSVAETTPGVYIFDTGQNHAGWTRLKVKGRAGTVITIRHGEALNPDGSVYVPNLRNAWQTDRYILRGLGQETFEPHFTIHGYRYIEVSGLPEPPEPDTVIARVAHSSSAEVGQFSSSSAYLNKLMNNILWTQRSNMIGIPTDCPQRDERLGWTGDELTFSQTAIFNMDMAGFFTKWMQDMRDDQSADGRFPDVAPNPMNVTSTIAPVFQRNLLAGSPAWADAGIVIPWRMYENYGDIQMLKVQYESAKRWVDFVHRNNPDLLWKNERGIDPGDWLNGDTLVEPGWPQQGGTTPHVVFATAFFAHSTEILSKMAAAIGRTDDARYYAELFAKIKTAFNQAYESPDGRIEGDTQAGYALALDFGLLPDDLRLKAVDHLLEGLSRYNGHVSTGFHATRSLMSQLTAGGHNDEAYRLLNLHSFPSWGYMLDMGATTIWERWDGYVADRGFQNHTAMNSLNHVAFGSVGEWIWGNVVGLAPDESYPGYKHFIVHPRLGGNLTSAKGVYDSVRGRIAIDWKIEGVSFSLDLLVPPNTSATIYLPTADSSKIQESGREVREVAGARFVRGENGSAIFEVGSGHFHFRSPM
jgi:alpha-L-rhamnosidase